MYPAFWCLKADKAESDFNVDNTQHMLSLPKEDQGIGISLFPVGVLSVKR